MWTSSSVSVSLHHSALFYFQADFLVVWQTMQILNQFPDQHQLCLQNCLPLFAVINMSLCMLLARHLITRLITDRLFCLKSCVTYAVWKLLYRSTSACKTKPHCHFTEDDMNLHTICSNRNISVMYD